MLMETRSPGDGRQSDNQGRESRESSGKAENTARASRPQSIQRTSGNFSPSLWSANPLETMARLSREMDQLVDAFFGGRFGLGGRQREGSFGASSLPEMWSPRIEVRERGNNVLISAELPGIQKDAIQIEATQDGIAISGERRESREENEDRRGLRFAERSYGSFYRNIPLPDGADVEQAKASMRDGVLEVMVPLRPGSQRRRIEITE
jgi:HSP20 family protein